MSHGRAHARFSTTVPKLVAVGRRNLTHEPFERFPWSLAGACGRLLPVPWSLKFACASGIWNTTENALNTACKGVCDVSGCAGCARVVSRPIWRSAAIFSRLLNRQYTQAQTIRESGQESGAVRSVGGIPRQQTSRLGSPRTLCGYRLASVHSLGACCQPSMTGQGAYYQKTACQIGLYGPRTR